MANQVLYGFMSLKDLLTNRVTTVGEGVVNDAIAATVAEHNRQMAALTRIFCQNTTEFKTRFTSASAARLQPLDEFGRARPIKPAGYYGVAFPLQMGGGAWGATWVTRAKMTVEEANRITSMLISADVRWMRDHILAALYTNVSWTFTDPEHDALTIQSLANADTTTYTILSGADSAATDTHFLAQAAAIADATNPYPTIFTELTEHPENGGQVVAFIPTDLKATTQALATFHTARDPNIREGANTDVLVGNLDVAVPGTLIGYEESGVWIVEWPSLPSGYIVATTTGGDPALAMREDVEAELQGFKQVAIRDDHPFWESQWARRAGFGAWNRVGAVVYRIGNASYAIPTNYTSPMA